MKKEVTLRIIKILDTDYLLPEDMTRKDLADLIATLAALRPIQNHFKSIDGKWQDAHYLGDMAVFAGSRTLPEIFSSKRAAEDHLAHLAQQAAVPESAF